MERDKIKKIADAANQILGTELILYRAPGTKTDEWIEGWKVPYYHMKINNPRDLEELLVDSVISERVERVNINHEDSIYSFYVANPRFHGEYKITVIWTEGYDITAIHANVTNKSVDFQMKDDDKLSDEEFEELEMKIEDAREEVSLRAEFTYTGPLETGLDLVYLLQAYLEPSVYVESVSDFDSLGAAETGWTGPDFKLLGVEIFD